MLDFNDAKPQEPEHGTDLQPADSYVRTEDARRMVQGREAEIVRALGIPWDGRSDHIHCPYRSHDDRNPSWRLMPNGCAVCTCSEPHSIFDVISKIEGCDFEAAKIRAAEVFGRSDLIVDPVAEEAGLTLADYAEAKRLPIDFLQQHFGLRGARYGKKDAVRIPYFGPDGSVQATRFRTALMGKKRFVWKRGSSICLYGAHRSAQLAATGYVVAVEGESDVQTLQFHGFEAVGIPGAETWREDRDAPVLATAPVIYVVIEPDKGGDAILRWLARSSIASRVRLVRLPAGFKDPSALHIADPGEFRAVFQQAMEAAEPFNPAPEGEPQLSGFEKEMAEFNRRYAVVNENGKVLVYERVRDPVLWRNVIVRIQFADLKKLYQNKRVSRPDGRGGTITKSAADWWLDYDNRRTYLDGVAFDPTNSLPPTYWNLWSGFAVEPCAGDWGLMRQHAHQVVCSGNDQHFDYLLNWSARMFQRPNEQGEVAVVVRGKKGAGKGMLLSALTRAWGSHGIHIRDAKHLVGNFNAHLRDCVCLFADEALFAGDRQHEGALKGLITEPTLPIEGKGQNLVTAPNMLHVIMSSNSDWVVPASHDERRYFVLDASDNRIGNRNYFSAMAQQMQQGGLAAMIYELLHRDLSGFEVRDIPLTDALLDQKKHSLDSIDRWWLVVLERGFVWRSRYGLSIFSSWQEFCSTELLYRSYQQWCHDARVPWQMSRAQLGIRMTAMYEPHRPNSEEIIGEVDSAAPGSLEEHLPIKQWRPTGYKVGDLDVARALFVSNRGVAGDWDLSAKRSKSSSGSRQG
jgi:Family of unknown function (DUF5906)